MRPKVNWSLYLVATPQLCTHRSVENVVRDAVQGGVTVVQLRNKECSTAEYVSQAERLHGVLKPLGIPLIINDRVDVAMAVGAEGVHVGQTDMAPLLARRLMGDDTVIGLSVDTPEQVLLADSLDVDYLGVGPIFATSTKPDTSPEWGCEGLRGVRRQSRHVLVAIGGINCSNAAEVMHAGADGIAVVSAICSAQNPMQRAAELRRIIENGRPI